MTDKLWITWEKQRRSTILSEEFGAKLFILENDSVRYIRYLSLSARTIALLIKHKPNYVFCQNPSIILAALLCLVKPAFGYRLIVDRHTNLKLAKKYSSEPKWVVFRCISNYSLKRADYTIVTNKYLKLLCQKLTNKIFILPDKVPEKNDLIASSQTQEPDRKTSALFICTFADDEPYQTIIEAARLAPGITVKMTGNYKKALSDEKISMLPENVVLLGFVSDEEYFQQIQKSSFTIVLTTNEFTLNCGSYESLALGTPMLLSDTRTIRSYFKFGALYTKVNSPQEIAQRLVDMEASLDRLRFEIQQNLPTMKHEWRNQFESLCRTI